MNTSNNLINLINEYLNEVRINGCLNEERIKFYEYSDFEDVRFIGEGGYGKVHRATLKSNKGIVALKSFKNNVAIEEVVKELKLHNRVGTHSNIIRLLGATKNEENFRYLSWDNKINFALQIASAVECLHAKNIVHCDLHSKNILIHQNCIKVSDFGISKRLGEVTTSSRNFGGMIPYMDPLSFGTPGNENRIFRFDKKSDVYSVGVLMWEISSGYPPFKNKHLIVPLAVEIGNGVRENPIEGTPSAYVKVFEDCWKHDPDSRPDIQQVLLSLQDLSIDGEQAINRIGPDIQQVPLSIQDLNTNDEQAINKIGPDIQQVQQVQQVLSNLQVSNTNCEQAINIQQAQQAPLSPSTNGEQAANRIRDRARIKFKHWFIHPFKTIIKNRKSRGHGAKSHLKNVASENVCQIGASQ
ncbi:kinase-like domain-containing protein [Gigaspora rosea]|uniref:Kinase-like domain-containing protein n=1 Tax=Gigaspora rosea TaxID=44941 RepID=A0A397VKG0_9GLOM|nr:kinase-like domain-containing protein [Gigaspora rosea]